MNFLFNFARIFSFFKIENIKSEKSGFVAHIKEYTFALGLVVENKISNNKNKFRKSLMNNNFF